MLKFNKKKILNLSNINDTLLLSSNSKGEKKKIRIRSLKEKVRLKKLKDINEMEISYYAIK